MKPKNRKEKIQLIRDLASGVDPRDKEQQTHVLYLKDYSSEALNNLLAFKKLSIEEMKSFLGEKKLDTEEQLKEFLHSDEFRHLMNIKHSDKVLWLIPSPNCDPISDQDDNGRHITTLQDYATKEPKDAKKIFGDLLKGSLDDYDKPIQQSIPATPQDEQETSEAITLSETTAPQIEAESDLKPSFKKSVPSKKIKSKETVDRRAKMIRYKQQYDQLNNQIKIRL